MGNNVLPFPTGNLEARKRRFEELKSDLADKRADRNEAEADAVYDAAEACEGKVLGPFPTPPDMPGHVVVKRPSPDVLKQFRHTLLLPDTKHGAAELKAKALPSVAYACVAWPSRADFERMIAYQPGISDKVAAAGLKLGEAEEEELGKE